MFRKKQVATMVDLYAVVIWINFDRFGKNDLRILGDPMLLTMIYLFLLVSVVLLLNLLIAQLNQTYEYINKDVSVWPEDPKF